MSDAHQQAARRLASLAGAERDWILARLPPAAALRIRELMEPGSGPVQAEPPVQADPPPAPTRLEPMPAAPVETPSTPQSILEHAAAADVSRLLQDEPDWFIALVLAKRRWPWDQEVLAGFGAARLEELSVLAWRAGEVAKPRACEAAVEALAAKLRGLVTPAGPVSAFDELLARMT